VTVAEDTDPRDEALQHAVEQATDILVYAPIGLLFEGPALLPTLVERGKRQVATARIMGEYTVRRGRRRATRIAAQVGEHADGLLALLGRRSDGAGSPSPTAARSFSPVDGRPDAPPPATPPAGSGDSSGLAIPDYDSLAASQVVNRLSGLAGDELEAVRKYEAAHRGRKTILNKVAQLQT
jgi:hypothetical protein